MSAIVFVLGPTASGKSAAAIQIAAAFGGEIVSGDAFAVYRGLDVGTAKPSAADRAAIPHHLLDVADPRETFSAGRWGAAARAAVSEIERRASLPIVAGGSHFYVRAMIHRLPGSDLRNEPLREFFGAAGGRLPRTEQKRWIDFLDPVYGRIVSAGDTARLRRALEVVLTTGRRVSERVSENDSWAASRAILKLSLLISKEDLYTRITERVEKMWMSGLPDEAAALRAAGVPDSAPAFRAIGYREALEFLDGRLSAEDARSQIANRTRQLARRQRTWLAAEKSLVPIEPRDAVDAVRSFLREPGRG